MNKAYVSLDALAVALGLPRRYLRELAQRQLIPHLSIGGRMRFQESDVLTALGKLAAAQTKETKQ